MQPEIFKSRGGFMELGHTDKYFVKNNIFLLNILKTKFWIENLKISFNYYLFFQNCILFLIFKKRQEKPPPLPLVVHLNVAEYASLSPHIPKYPWKILTKLFWLCQGSEYAWSSFMFDRLLKMPRVLNVPGF